MFKCAHTCSGRLYNRTTRKSTFISTAFNFRGLTDLEYPNVSAPTLASGVEVNVIRKRICLARRYRWYMILVTVHNGDYF